MQRNLAPWKLKEPTPTLAVKVQTGAELRRFHIDWTTSWSELQEQLADMAPTKLFQVRYEDEDGDMISIDSQEELFEAIKLLRAAPKPVLRLVLTPAVAESEGEEESEDEQEVQVQKEEEEEEEEEEEKEEDQPQEDEEDDDEEEEEEEVSIDVGGLLNSVLGQVVPQIAGTLCDQIRGELQAAMRIAVATGAANATAAPSRPAPTGPEHRGVRCDGCNGGIVGVRFKCGMCDDFDLCEACEARGGVHDATHLFIKVTTPRRFPRGPLLSGLEGDDRVPFGLFNHPFFNRHGHHGHHGHHGLHGRHHHHRHAHRGDMPPPFGTMPPGFPPHPHMPPHPFAEFMPPFAHLFAGLHQDQQEQGQQQAEAAPATAAAATAAESATTAASAAAAASKPEAAPTQEVPSQFRHRGGARRFGLGRRGFGGMRPMASFVVDENLPDGTTVAAGEVTKQWRLRNSGSAAWPADTVLRFVGGNMRGVAHEFPVPVAQPGETVVASVKLVVHPQPGRYRSHWQLFTGSVPFGDTIWADLLVAEPAKRPTPTTTTVTIVPAAVAAAAAAPRVEEDFVVVPPAATSAAVVSAPASPVIAEPAPAAAPAAAAEPAATTTTTTTTTTATPTPTLAPAEVDGLRVLFEMGFFDRTLNTQLLAKHKGDVQATANELLELMYS